MAAEPTTCLKCEGEGGWRGPTTGTWYTCVDCAGTGIDLDSQIDAIDAPSEVLQSNENTI